MKAELMTIDAADGSESYTALVTVQPNEVVFNLGFTFRVNRESLREVCERLLELLGPCPACEEADKHANSDATTPGFFYSRCRKHRPKP